MAPDGFGTSLTPAQAADALRAGWSDGAPHDVIDVCPLADGGPGFVATLHATLGGDLEPVTVTGPLGEPALAAVLRVGATVHVESAHAVGLALVPEDRRDPTRTTSRGAGELLAAVLPGAHRVVVGLGGSATNDAGAGLLLALADALLPAGTVAPDVAARLGGGGGALGSLGVDDLRWLPDLRAALRGADLVAAVDVDVPLLGLQGASAGFSAQKGATQEQAQDLERALGAFAHAATAALGPVRTGPGADLLGSPDARAGRLSALPGAGAAGGLGFALALLGARLLPGARLVADAVDLPGRIAAHDLVVTGEGRTDWQSLHGKVVAEVAARALPYAVPAVVVSGEVLVGRRELSAAGITAAYAVADGTDAVRAALGDPTGTLRARAARVARTWSPARAS
ncbi:glycerate kinase [Cellulomonas sp. zg-Y908]|uniref:Glycerate kinase n=2 Tax=Cellulomonas wangsupingiae TaxID=2968085 RepID=A0ABY5K993_9CELL|nr:glycerate kinase [Cellulomonas wangsupingiae]MCC2333490.1 glycerate kinase [Cellulomonas wangsupingiae]UUI67039.1 glycerate kinase [Cellulomonas wangsupingiae]